MRVTRAAFMLAVATAAIVASAAAPAVAAVPVDSAIEVSLDGTSWSALPPDGLFPSELRLAPGDMKTAELFVRSTHSGTAVLSIAVTDAETNQVQFSRDLRIGGGDADSTMTPTPFIDIATCANLIEPRTVTQTDVTAVSIDLLLEPGSGNLTQGATANFDLAIGLTELGVPADPSGCPLDATIVSGIGGNDGVILAYTGGTVQYPALIGAGLAIGTGWLLILGLIRRRRRENETAPG